MHSGGIMPSLKYRITAISIFVVVLATAIHAVPNQPLSYQGRLTDVSGNPVADGTYSVTFAIYAELSGGEALWTEKQEITLSGGLFTALLGSVNSIDPSLFSSYPRYLGITVSGDPEMTPRIRMATVPYVSVRRKRWLLAAVRQ